MARKKRIKDRQEPIHFLRGWRRTRALTQEKLAERAGLSHSTISRIENGETDLTRDAAAALSAALLINIPDLFRDPEDPQSFCGLSDRIKRLSPDQIMTVESIINAFLKAANGQP